ncbi:hypothetical protein DFH11DRAFT_1552811 [Phellopilus nigrolimitatus]|nr:hypothetical protein DFH11DRAFT_1552811 [Phellopilus nigrolimitatus]
MKWHNQACRAREVDSVEGHLGDHDHVLQDELVRNITIKLGYANAKGCYCLYCSDREDRPPCEHHMKLLRHNILMATVLNGAGFMDTSLLLIAGNESYLQPQISEYLTTVEIMKLQNIIIMQNKVDLIKEVQTLGHQKSIAVFVMKELYSHTGTVTEASPIVPISAQLKYNVDAVNEYIVKRISIPGCNRRRPIFINIIMLLAENNQLQFAAPGGLIGVGTMGDPMLCHSDRLVGQVLGAVGKLPHIYICTFQGSSSGQFIDITSDRGRTRHAKNSDRRNMVSSVQGSSRWQQPAKGAVRGLTRRGLARSACFLLLRRLLGVKTEDKKTTNVVLLLINNGSILAGTCVLSVKMDFEMLMHPLPVPRRPALRWCRPYIGYSTHSTYITARLGARQGHRHTCSALLRSSTFHMLT